MRKIEAETIAAVRRGQCWRKGNMEVWVSPESGVIRVKLHGNTIATRTLAGEWAFTLAGWPTPTTRSRINALARAFRPDTGVWQERNRQYFRVGELTGELGDEEWF